MSYATTNLPLPIVDSYDFSGDDATIIAETMAGQPRVEVKTLAPKAIFNVTFIYTEAQLVTFIDWWESTIANGTATFTIDLQGPSYQLETYTCNFALGIRPAFVRQGLNYSVQATLIANSAIIGIQP